MNFRLTILFFFFTPLIFGQTNLVPNPSFEEYDTCSPGQNIFISTGWKSYSGSPDYYCGCADTSSGFSVPYNLWGFEPAANGNAYSGFYSYQSDNANLREYIGTKLAIPLSIGNSYFVSFKVKPVANVYNINMWGCDVVNNGIGILFSTKSFIEFPFPDSSGCVVQPPNRSTIYSPNVIDDTSNWTSISGYFIADSAYQYFKIGTLYSDSLIDTVINIAANPYPWHIAYYFLDDIILLDSLTGISIYNSENNYKIFPNPATNELTIDLTIPDKYIFELHDLLGAKRLSVRLDNSSKTVDLTAVDSGVYVFTIVDSKGDIIKTDKIIIIK